MLELIRQDPVVFAIVIGLVGLCVGSFLNVVIYRLPVMMERDWKIQSAEFLEMPDVLSERDRQPYNLNTPNSTCPSCHQSIKPWQNIPVLSYLLLGGRCANCKQSISKRYPLIEGLTALLSVLVAWHFGYGLQTMFALILLWSLIALSLIDIDHHLLPDSITLPLIWTGLFVSLFDVFTDTRSAVIGAIAGYLCLWSVYMAFKLLTGKEGMGFGDFKLLSAFGAWFGWKVLPVIIFLSSAIGAVIGVTMIIFFKRSRETPIPFGPYLAGAGLLALFWGDQLVNWYLGRF
ncbi:MAG: A24 family peptidase [Gammaproteobacteria bacterium]|nr:A24 family peptidase [Gammaproteobacteria bacterium]